MQWPKDTRLPWSSRITYLWLLDTCVLPKVLFTTAYNRVTEAAQSPLGFLNTDGTRQRIPIWWANGRFRDRGLR